MGIFGIGREEANNSSNSSSSNEEVVKNIVSEVSLTTEQEVKEIEKEGINPEERGLIDTFRSVKDPINRRDFLKFASVFAAGIAVGCAPKPVQDILKSTTESMYPKETEIPKVAVKREILLDGPKSLNTKEFSIGTEGYPNAIVDRSMFANKENGEPLFLRYSGSQFNEVTYLHYTAERPPVVGEILPLMYKVPEDIDDREIGIIPYAISIKSDRASIKFNDGKNHYLVPIVTSGTNSGIVQNMREGQAVNTSYRAFEIKPDNVSGNTSGFLSWAVLTEIGNELVVEGVTYGAPKIYIDFNNIPIEVKELMGE